MIHHYLPNGNDFINGSSLSFSSLQVWAMYRLFLRGSYTYLGFYNCGCNFRKEMVGGLVKGRNILFIEIELF